MFKCNYIFLFPVYKETLFKISAAITIKAILLNTENYFIVNA